MPEVSSRGSNMMIALWLNTYYCNRIYGSTLPHEQERYLPNEDVSLSSALPWHTMDLWRESRSQTIGLPALAAFQTGHDQGKPRKQCHKWIFQTLVFFFAGELKLRKKMINGYQWMKNIFFKTYIQHNICIIWICVTNVSCLFSSADVQLSIFHSHSHRGVHRGPGHCKGPGAPHHGRHRASRAKLLSLKESMAPPFGIFQQRSFVCLMFLLVAQIGRCTPIRLTVIISQRWKLV